MKKLFAIFLLVMYSFSSSGMSISLHYCCGKLKSIDWQLPKQKDCDHNQKMGGKPCCETKLITVKEKTDQNSSRPVLKAPLPEAIELKSFSTKTILQSKEIVAGSHVDPSPPLRNLPLFIINRVFRI